MPTNAQTIRMLTELIVVSRDGTKGFRACAAHAASERLKRLVTERAEACERAVQELQALVRELGEASGKEPTVFGLSWRRWLDVRTAFPGGDDATIVAEFERGSDYVLEIYRNALDEPLPDFVHRVVLRQFEAVMNNHDQIRILGSENLARGCAAAAPPASEVTS